MPSALASQPAPARHDDLDNYDAGTFSDDDIFGPSSPEASSKKRKVPESGLGIDEEVSVQKRARVPNVKLDEDRLLGPAGIPKLKTRAGGLKLKGKGHEFSDAARLLSFYQLWLDDLFPKAKFLDALAMVEKAGHKRKLMTARNEWIHDSKPKDHAEDDEEGDQEGGLGMSSRTEASHGDQPAGEKPTTPPPRSDIPDDEDLYDATPRAPGRTAAPANDEVGEEDDLDALIAEAEGTDTAPAAVAAEKPTRNAEPDGDDLDALIAEAEGEDEGNGAQKESRPAENAPAEGGFADDEAAMQEMEGLW